MKKTLCMLTLMGAGIAALAQDNQKQMQDDGRMAAQDMLNMKYENNAPLLQTYVPDEVVSNAKNTYGERLYAIKQVKSGDGEDVYHVTLLDNGQSSVAWIGATGSEGAYVYRSDDNSTMANRQTNTTEEQSTTTEPATAAPTVDDNNAPTNTLDETPAQPQQNTIDENTMSEPQMNELNSSEESVNNAPETTPEPSEALKPEEDDLMQ